MQTAATDLTRAAREGARYLREHGSRVAWIMGSSRSGSSWLLRMLASLDRVTGIDDPHIAHHLSVWRPLPLAWATAGERPELTTLSEVKRAKPGYFFSDAYREAWEPGLAELIRQRFGAQLAAQAPLECEPRLIIKEPGSHPADLLLGAIPGARLIFLLRDGRDVVDSWLDAYSDGSWAIGEGAYAAAPQRRLALVEWLSATWAFRTQEVAKVFTRLAPDRRLLIRYERLRRNPAAELRRITSLLGMDAAAGEIEAVAHEQAFERIEATERGSGHETRRAQPGGWRTALSEREQEAMHEIMAAELTLFGYEVPKALAVS